MKIIFPTLLFFVLSACSYIGTIYNIGSKVGAVIMDERDLDDDWKDSQINLIIRKEFAKTKFAYLTDVEITVFEGDVMLNGAIPNIDNIDEILEIVWNVDGVQRVYNYLRHEKPSDIIETSQDAIIAASIRTQLSLTQGVTSVNYKITVDDSIVYMLGIAKNPEEYSAVLAAIQSTNGVQKVISNVRYSYENNSKNESKK